MSEIVLASTREAAGQAILELAQEGVDVVAVSADTSKSMYTTLLKKDYPERFVDTGIAEQNMVMVAAGLASTGKIAFAASYSVFTSMRCCEQLRTFVAYPNLNVKVIAGIGGLSAGIEGVTHVATEDLGIVRCIANMAVVAPSDAVTTKKAVKAAAAYDGPVYIRVGRDSSPALFDDSYSFEIGCSVQHRTGGDVTLLVTGLVTTEVLDAARVLADSGIHADVIEVHTLKPLRNPDMILKSALKTERVVTVEEHNIVGGLGTVVSEILAGNGNFRIKKLGLQDTFAESGTPDELIEKYGLKASNIVKETQNLLQQ
ncbi:MAG: transketolase family protein [bacterium]|nr:transketolase family protein [bacterium]